VPRSQAPLGNARPEAPLPVRTSGEAELGNEGRRRCATAVPAVGDRHSAGAVTAYRTARMRVAQGPRGTGARRPGRTTTTAASTPAAGAGTAWGSSRPGRSSEAGT